MSSSIAVKNKKLNLDFLKKTGGYIVGATGDYISEVMPTTSSTLSEAKSTISQVTSGFASMSQNASNRIKQFKSQANFKNIYRWYMEKEDEFDDSGLDLNLEFDSDIDSSDIAEAQFNENEKNSNKIAKAVVESSKQMVESQISSIATLDTTIDKQTAVITSGFDNVNNRLDKILEVLTKNTSAMIEATTAIGGSLNNKEDDLSSSMIKNGKFDLSSYKKLVGNRIKNDPMVSMLQMIPMIISGTSPQDIFKSVIGFGINKASPNLEKNLKALDSAVNDTIMQSLIRLGNAGRNNPFGPTGILGKFLGLDASRKSQSTERSTFDVKATSFDTITRESITNTIPGYLRKILVALGGDDVVYDYRSRSFKTQRAINKEFLNTTANSGSIYASSSKVRDAIGTSSTSNMAYELLLSQLSTERSPEKKLGSFKNEKAVREYFDKYVMKGVKIDKDEQKEYDRVIKGLVALTSNNGIIDIAQQASKNTIYRNNRVRNAISEYDKYNIDISGVEDSHENERKTILARYGKIEDTSTASISDPKAATGFNYTNIVLYEIFRKLDTGINVFQMGSKNSRKKPYARFGNKFVSPPLGYKPKIINDPDEPDTSTSTTSTSSSIKGDDEPNLLQNQTNEDGTTEQLTTGQRVGRWAKHRGGNLRKAIFSGSPEEVRAAFGNIITDIGQVSSSFIKDQLLKINDNNENIAGYLKHKITGSSYKYTKDGKEYEVKKNENGGYLGYFNNLIFGPGGYKAALKNTSSNASKWVKSVAGYFNYGDKEDKDSSIDNKRNKIFSTAIGSMLGAGILGGPLGLIMGGIAGNAISQTSGIGSKIKKLLFGDKEHEGDKKKDRDKRRGLIGKVVDNITDPIRYQIGKTMTSFGSVLKKNIMGPLSNIGEAIKERMSNAAGKVADTAFGKVFKGMGGLLKKFLMFPLNVAKAPITAIGNLVRGGTETGGAVIGGGLNSIAKMIAGKEGRDKINQRIKSQKADADMDKAESGYYNNSYEADYVQDPDGPPGKMIKVVKRHRVSGRKDWESWKENQDIERDQLNIDDYTKEETVELTSEIAENTKATKDAVETLADHGTTEGSIFTHDKGLHERLDEIIKFITGKKKSIGKSDNNDNEIISSTIPAAASIIASNDVITDSEHREVTNLIDEGAKKNPNKSTILNRLKNLMGGQKKKSQESDEEKTSIWDKIGGVLSNIKDVLGGPMGIAALIAAVLGFTGKLDDLLTKFGQGASNLLDWVVNGGEKENVVLNTLTAPLGFQADSEIDYFNPLADLTHVNTDAAGNEIVNQNVTRAKNSIWRNAGLVAGSNLMSAGLQHGIGLNAMDAAKYGDATASGMRARQNLNKAKGVFKSKPMQAMGKMALRTGIGSVAGKGANWLVSNIAEKVGMDEESSDMLGRGTEAVTQVSSTLGVGPIGKATKKLINSILDEGGTLNTIAKKIIEVLKNLGEKLASSKTFKPIASKLKDLIGKFTSKITEPVLKKLGSVVTKIFAKETGKAVGAGVTLGVSIAVMSAGGAV